MFNYTMSRYIIEHPWLHNTIGFLFFLCMTCYLVSIPSMLYYLLRNTEGKKKEWSFEGKNWNYWKTKK